jgi:hypothetical protein
MCFGSENFSFLIPQLYYGHVVLGDGKSKLLIHGFGPVRYFIGDNILVVKDVWYIPDFAEAIYISRFFMLSFLIWASFIL